MPTNPNWPLTVTQFSTSVPFGGATPSWVDISSRTRDMRSSYGRQYELDVIETGEARFTVDNKDEYLNPTNPSSPYFPNVKPYRQIVDQAMWPPLPVTSATGFVFRQATSAVNGAAAASSFTVAAPADLVVGDDLFIAVGTSNVAITSAPAGFTVTVGPTTKTTVLTTTIYHKVASATDIGGTFAFSLASAARYSAVCIAVDANNGPTGTSPVLTIADAQQVAEPAAVAAHATPNATATLPQSVLIGVWAWATIGGTWTGPPAGDTQLGLVRGAHATSNNVSLQVTASPVVGPATYSRTANTDATTSNCTMSLLVLSVDNAVNLLNSTAGYDPSFENTAVGAIPPNLLTLNTTPTTVAANPFVGVNSLQWSVLGNSTQQTAGFTVPTIPGQQYTASCYYRQTAANVGVLFINGGASSTTTTTTGAYVRLTVTFTASQPTHQLLVGSSSPTLASTVNIDAVQVEPGPSASTFSVAGPVIYTPFAGYVERWPVNWNHQGTFGSAGITCVDSMAALGGVMHTEYRRAVLSKNPRYYWTMSETAGETFGETSGNSGPSMLRVDAAEGPGSVFNAGAQINIAGDPSSTGLACSTSTWGFPSSVARAGSPVGYGTQNLNIPGGGNEYSIAFWASHTLWTTGNGDPSGQMISLGRNNGVALASVASIQNLTTPLIRAGAQPPNYGGWLEVTTPDVYADGKPHLYVITVVGTASSSPSLTLYVDGVSRANVAPGGSNTGAWTATYLDTGGDIDALTGQGTPPAFNGIYAHMAVWNRVLTATEVADLWQAGRGYPGEKSGQRIARYLSIGQYVGPTAIDQGQSIMGVSTLAEGQALLDACQQIALSENGTFYAEGGTIFFKARTNRYFKTTAKWIFGERAVLGEVPYEGDVAYDYDPTRIMNDVKITRTAGITAAAADQASQNSYLRHSYARTIGVQSDLEAIDAANYLLNRGKEPAQRVSRLTIKPSANPALWPVALGARLGDRVTVKRRTSAGYVMSADYFIERIEHNRGSTSWATSFQLSPVLNMQVWVLEDSVYGVLDTTTIPAY